MNTFAKRGLSLLLALVMCLGTLSGLTFSISAAENSDTWIYNQGARGIVATQLSDAAVAFYESNNVTYSELAALSGASAKEDVPSSALYEKLKTLMTSNHDYITSYDDTREMYAYTDCQNGGGKISSFYSGTEIGPEWDSGATWNREHTWPNSKGDASGNGENDIMMLRPASKSENSSRGNKAYGESSSFYDPNEESNGTLNLHGDVARIMLYVYVRWGNTGSMWGESGVIESKDVLIDWIIEDPVDTWELGRNDVVESITGTRNVFVDYPELALLMFEEDIPADYQTPSSEGSTTDYHITAFSGNSLYGTVSLSGKTITATPAEGCYVEGYEVTSGTATVTRNGNTFLVVPESNCSVMINFAQKTSVTLTFMEDGVTTSTVSAYGGDAYTLPANKNTPADGYNFIGWVISTVDKTTEKPTVYTAGSSYTAANQTFFALYACSESADGETSGVYSLYNGDLVEGDYLIVYDSGAMQAADADSSGRIDYADVTVTNDHIVTPDADLIWHIAPTSDGYYTIYNSANKVYAAGTTTNNKSTLLSSVTNYAKWTVSGSSTYDFVNLGNSRYLRKNSTFGYACYAQSTGGSLSLYKGNTGTTYYSTVTNTCVHENIEEIPAVAATCTQTGLTSGIYCNDCQRVVVAQEIVPVTDHQNLSIIEAVAPSCTQTGLSEGMYCNDCQSVVLAQETVAATGHSYSSVITPPTTTEQGYTTYTCTVCGESYVGDYTDATGEIFTVSFWVPDGVADVAAMECGKSGIMLPSAGAPEGYTFAGWALQSVEDTETAPTIYTANSTYTATANTDLYAVYTYVTEGTGNSQYVKVTEAPADWSGEYLIVYEADGLVFDGSLEKLDAASNYQAVTITNNTISAEANMAYQFIIAKTANGYSIQSASGYYIGTTSNSNSLNTSTSTVYTNTISLDADSNANIISSGGAYLRYNSTSNQKRFRYYKSSTYTGQKAIALYVLTEDGITHYTSLGSTKTVVAAVYSGASLVKEYVSFNDAVAACESGQYIKLLSDVEAESILEADLYIDLNGHSVTGLLMPDTYSVYGMDSTTNSYNGDSVGYFNCTDENDQQVVPVTHFKSDVTGAIKRYMTVETEKGYTFHRFYMGITHASVKPGTVGVGYKAVFAGDDAVKAQIGSYGIKLWVEGNESYTATLSLNNSDFVSGKAVTVRVDNIDVENYGETPLNAHVFMTLTDGTQVEVEQPTATISMTLQQMVENVNTNYTAYTSAQLAALKEMLDKYSITANWNIDNI